MSLKSLNLKGVYDSDEDNLLEDFYIPVLSEAVTYKRIAGFFSSNAFAIAAKGIAKFIENGGRIQLIANVVLSGADQEAIKKAIEEKEDKLIREIESMDEALKKGHIRLLAWLLKNDKLEIKIALVPGGLEHIKSGILEDKDGNILFFSGSGNETVKGWLQNDEEFNVHFSWKEGQNELYIAPAIKKFDDRWNDETTKVRVYSVSDAFKKALIKTAPKNEEEFKVLSKEMIEGLLKKNGERIREIGEKNETAVEEKPKKLILRSYQAEAVKNWFENNRKGFFRMATGTGKTETAIGVMKQLIEEKKPLFVIIAVYGKPLLKQWIKKLRNYGYQSNGASSDFSDWRKEFDRRITGVSLGYEDYAIFVATYQTFSSSDFIELSKTIQCDTLLICDEVHHAGATEFRKGLLESYSYRLGLSATPARWFDEEGTTLLKSYFDKTVYPFSMQRAMTEINPSTGKTYLCQYTYYPKLIDLTAEENERIIEFNKKIGRRCHILGKYDRSDPYLKKLSMDKADIKKNAKFKIDGLEKIFQELGDNLTFCIIYCSGKQLEEVKRLLQKYHRIAHEFTQHQSSLIREKLLEEFESGRDKGGYDVLLAIDCLNEGIDVPKARIGIFLENSTNPIEFIQRRGRLLRQTDEEKEAICYDFLIEPSFSGLDEGDAFEQERKELQKEFDRFFEFAHLARNTREAMKKMERIINKYNLIINIREDDVL